MLHGDRKRTGFMHENTENLPSSVDLRKKEAVTGVKDQDKCGKYVKLSLILHGSVQCGQ